jgi:hypothetical protein
MKCEETQMSRRRGQLAQLNNERGKEVMREEKKLRRVALGEDKRSSKPMVEDTSLRSVMQ